MKVLVACEYSGRVRDAFSARGHYALSCDLLPSEAEHGRHYRGDVRDILGESWDLLIAHPDCTFHTLAGVRWFTTIPANPKPGKFYGAAREGEWRKACTFFRLLQQQKHIKRICIENPLMHGRSLAVVGKYTQIVQPWMFGHGETKATCLWLKGLEELVPTNIVPGREHRVHAMSPGPLRWKERSRTYLGIADAMAARWG